MPSIYEILAVKRWSNGGVSIGNSYLGTTPPANGMLIEGQVGIGTTTPSYGLDVTRSGSVAQPWVNQIEATDDSAQAVGTGGGITFSGRYITGDGTIGQMGFVRAAKESAVSGNYAFGLAFGTRVNGQVPAEVMRIAGSGIVSMPAYGAGTATFDANGVISSVSDERLKTAVRPLPYGLKEVLQLHPIAYHYSAESGLDTEHEYGGFGAIAVEPIMPLAVGRDSRGYRTFADRPVLGSLVNAVKEHNALIVAQAQRIAALEAEVAGLRTRLKL